MTLTEKVTFTTALQTTNRVQIPRLIRWRFKMDCEQALKVGVNFTDLHRGWQFFYAKMRKDGRITIPRLVLTLFGSEQGSLAGCVVEVMLEPA